MKKYTTDPFGKYVIEIPTEQVVWRTSRRVGESARAMANWLNGGHGFNGYTPPFFLNRFSVA